MSSTETLSYPELGAGLRISLNCLCDIRVDFDFSVELYPDEPWRIIHRDPGLTYCPECGIEVNLLPCWELGHAWREFTIPRGPVTICLVCGTQPHVPLRPAGGATAAGLAELRTTSSV